LIAEELDYKRKDVVIEDRLYGGGADDLLEVIHRLDDRVKSVMLFGHNPELTELAHRISSQITHLPTCAVAEFRVDAKSWPNFSKATLSKAALDYPKQSQVLTSCLRRLRPGASRRAGSGISQRGWRKIPAVHQAARWAAGPHAGPERRMAVKAPSGRKSAKT